MTALEIKKIKVELLQVQAARANLELRIDEHEADIERLRTNIDIQIAKEKELEDKIKNG